MTLDSTPLRLLVKTYASGLLDRQQYLDIRRQILRRLSRQGTLTEEDLQNFLNIHKETDEQSGVRQYSVSDWIIIVLGLCAAAALGVILYS